MAARAFCDLALAAAVLTASSSSFNSSPVTVPLRNSCLACSWLAIFGAALLPAAGLGFAGEAPRITGTRTGELCTPGNGVVGMPGMAGNPDAGAAARCRAGNSMPIRHKPIDQATKTAWFAGAGGLGMTGPCRISMLLPGFLAILELAGRRYYD